MTFGTTINNPYVEMQSFNRHIKHLQVLHPLEGIAQLVKRATDYAKAMGLDLNEVYRFCKCGDPILTRAMCQKCYEKWKGNMCRPKTILTVKQISEIKRLFQNGMKFKDIAVRFSIAERTASKAAKGFYDIKQIA